MLSRRVEPAVTRLGNGGKMLLSYVKVEQENSLNIFALTSPVFILFKFLN